MTIHDDEPIVATEDERPALNKIEDVLKNVHSIPKLVSPDGEKIELPRSVLDALQQVVNELAHERAVAIVPVNKELTTQEAADLLNVSRPYLIKLLEQGELPFFKLGTHRRIRLDDLMEYRKRRDEERERGLAELTQLSQEYGLYD
jgi:excisionase family DNA binding protein